MEKSADLDASAFLLGADGTIINDADFVFYKSAANRENHFHVKNSEVNLLGGQRHGQCRLMALF